jgi:NADH dehydrogenase
MKKVVIVGGGFGGVKAARELARDRRFEVTLICERDTFEYHAALYRSATGRSPLEVAVPLGRIFAKQPINLVLDTVTDMDAKNRTVTGKSGKTYPYDELILALGTVTAYFGIQGLPEFSYNIKTIEDAMRLKAHLHQELTSGHKPDLNYVVVGGGPSGVELAGELVSYLKHIRKSHNVDKNFHVDLVEAAPRLLPMMPEAFSRKIENRLKKLGVRVYTSTAVKGETADALQLPEGNIKTHTVIWTAGMTNHPFFKQHEKLFVLGKGGKVKVNEYLSAGDNIWILGDSADTAKTGWAQTAIYDGGYIASNLKRGLSGEPARSYAPSDPIGAIPVGPNWCAVSMRGLQFYGYFGWLVRRWSDMKLYRNIMPLGLATYTWLMGTRADEECPQCTKRAA